MNKRILLILLALLLVITNLTWAVSPALAKDPPGQQGLHYKEKITPADRKAAAARFKKARDAAIAAGTFAPAALDPGGIPHYFGPYPNYANSPLPSGAVTAVAVTDGGTGYTAPVVTISDAYGIGTGATVGTVTVDPLTGAITAITLGGGGSGYYAPFVSITDATGTDAAATATIAGSILTGGIHKFIDSLPGVNTANNLGQMIPKAIPDTTTYPAGGTGYTSAPTITINDATGTGAIATATVAGGIVTGVVVNNGGTGYSANPVVVFSGGSATSQAIGVATVANGVITGITLTGADYYEIEVGQYTEKLHTDLPATTLRGYRQTNTTDPAASAFHYLGPLIVAERNKPVRIKFTNALHTTAAGGNLFLPVDTTVMGAGMGPDGMNMYTENRATLHLHGGFVPWISDGTPHQWTTPAGETTPYPKGVSVYNVPDMPNPGKPPAPPAVDPGAGTLTFYYNNQQSARLMFYHDHSYGITRLNVYAGEAAPYLLTDQVEKDLINGTNNSGVNPGLVKLLPDTGIPLVIQDKTFVDPNTIAWQDPTWNSGTTPPTPNGGDLWYPHVYVPAQNPWDPTGANPFGRWHYAAWFWPPATLTHPPVPNEYYQPDPNLPNYDPALLRPDTPNPSAPGEAFMDTPMVNGTVYPYLNVEPKAYRFRILNAADDRFFSLQLYQTGVTVHVINGGSGYSATPAVTLSGGGATTQATAAAIVTNGVITGVKILTPGVGYTSAPTVAITDATGTGALAIAGYNTEVSLVPAVTTPGFPATWPTDGREGGVPDPTTQGPSWVQIGTEGGFLPAPVVIPNQPVAWNLVPTNFNFGNVTSHSLLLGTAERADVIVDFSNYAGKTLILYNDAPAAFPALDTRYDYYSGNPDQTDTGGTPMTQPGYGPNTRTIMQFRVGLTATPTVPPYTFNLAALQAAFAKTATKRGVFEVSQDPIIMPQAAYNSAYNPTTPFPGNATSAYVQQHDFTKTFTPIGSTTPVTVRLEPKAIQDEMGEAFDTDYGRMMAMLGLELPATSAGAQNFMLYGYASPPVDIVQDSVITKAPVAGDGTQLWKITHNGVDTHTVHTHLFNVQVINRVAWDGQLLPPDPNELGWKETFRVNPLEHMVIALRPIAPTQPFEVPNSVHLIDVTMPLNAPLAGPLGGFKDPMGNPVTVTNHLVNFGWEYVYHCHLLAHEEMDMMHSVLLAVAPRAPSNLTAALKGNSLTLTWMDNSNNETGFTIQRAGNAGFTTGLVTWTVGPGVTTYTDSTIKNNQSYYYRVAASNTVGDTATPGFPTKTANSAFVMVGPPMGTTNLLSVTQAPPGATVVVTWSYSLADQTGFTIQRATDPAFTKVTDFTAAANATSFPDTTKLKAGTLYYYRVAATNSLGTGTLSNVRSITAQ